MRNVVVHKEPGAEAVIGQDVHVWFLPIQAQPHEWNRFQLIMDAAERSRSRTFASEELAAQYIFTRGSLRLLLAEQLHIRPEDLQFEYNAYGKPRVARSHGCRLQFNLSHTESMLMIGLHYGAEIGVDLEEHKDDFGFQDIADSYFTAREASLLQGSLDAASRRELFYRLWSGKEAVMKATGEGLNFGLENVSLGLDDEGVMRLNAMAPDKVAASHLEFYDLTKKCQEMAGSKKLSASAVLLHRSSV